MSYKGKFRPKNHKKYHGNFREVIYRSSWELKFMQYCDTNKNIVRWSSEEIVIPYRSPVDNRIHRYFPDFYVKSRTKSGGLAKRIIEIKPFAQTQAPATQKRKTQKFLKEVATYGVNQAKWKAAKEYCKDRRMQFVILTENELRV